MDSARVRRQLVLPGALLGIPATARLCSVGPLNTKDCKMRAPDQPTHLNGPNPEADPDGARRHYTAALDYYLEKADHSCARIREIAERFAEKTFEILVKLG